MTDTPPELDLLVCSPWATPDDVAALGPKYAELVAGVDDSGSGPGSLLWLALGIASDVMYLATGRQYPGLCGDIVRPCARFGGKPIAAYHGQVANLVPATWEHDYGWGACECAGGPRTGCCAPRSRVRLGHYPVASIDSVTVDGEPLAEGIDYWLEDDRWLVRLPDPETGDRRGWPCCQRLDLPATEVDTFEVALTYGQAPPLGGVTGAAQFGGEIGLDLIGSDECSLGEKVRSYTRQGTQVQISQPPDDILEALPRLARLFIRAVNPLEVRRPATVWSPDVGRPVTRPNSPGPLTP